MGKIITFFKEHRIIANLVYMFFVLILIFIGLNYWLHSYTRHDQATTLPTVKGMTVEEAANVLERYNLRFEIIDSIHNDKKAPGIVLEQIPAPDTKIKEGRVVYLTINATTPRQVKVPNLINSSVRQAEAQLKSLGFHNVIIEYKSSPYKNLVLGIEYNGRNVSAGEKLPVSGRLVMIVGSGDGSGGYSTSGDSVLGEENVIEELTDKFFQ